MLFTKVDPEDNGHKTKNFKNKYNYFNILTISKPQQRTSWHYICFNSRHSMCNGKMKNYQLPIVRKMP
jgi:hypothetical protein